MEENGGIDMEVRHRVSAAWTGFVPVLENLESHGIL